MFEIEATKRGLHVVAGTKWPSMMSIWRKEAPEASARAISSFIFSLFAARIEGAMRGAFSDNVFTFLI
jgi:hypothetical protein